MTLNSAFQKIQIEWSGDKRNGIYPFIGLHNWHPYRVGMNHHTVSATDAIRSSVIPTVGLIRGRASAFGRRGPSFTTMPPNRRPLKALCTSFSSARFKYAESPSGSSPFRIDSAAWLCVSSKPSEHRQVDADERVKSTKFAIVTSVTLLLRRKPGSVILPAKRHPRLIH